MTTFPAAGYHRLPGSGETIFHPSKKQENRDT